MYEPIVASPDGTILSGHLRLTCLLELGYTEAPVRIHPGFDKATDELLYLIDSNTKRRHLTPRQIAMAYTALKELVPEASAPPSRRKRADAKNGPDGVSSGEATPKPSRVTAEDRLGVTKKTAEALATVFTSKGVPDEVQQAVDSGKLKATVAAKVVRGEVKRQGGTIRDPSAVLEQLSKPKVPKAVHARLQSVRDSLRRALADMTDGEEIDACVEALGEIIEVATQARDGLEPPMQASIPREQAAVLFD